MIPYTVYYDASGTQSDPRSSLVVAGLISTQQRWERFDKDWAQVLSDPEFNVPYLHMKEFAHSVKGSPFEDWKGKEEKRGRFLASLHGVIKQWVNKASFMYAPLADYVAANAKYVLEESFGGAYSLAAVACYGNVTKWMRAKHPGQPLAHVFEAGDEGQKLFTAFSKVAGVYPIIHNKFDPLTGGYITPFQAADWMAYEYALELGREDEPGQRQHAQRVSFQQLHWHIPCQIKEYTAATYERLCEAHPEHFPRRG